MVKTETGQTTATHKHIKYTKYPKPEIKQAKQTRCHMNLHTRIAQKLMYIQLGVIIFETKLVIFAN